MADYRPNKIVDMIMILGKSHNNYAAAARLYAAILTEDIPVMSQFKLSFKELKMELLFANADIINTTKMPALF